MCIDVLLAYMFVCHMCDLCLQRPDKGARAPETGLIASTCVLRIKCGFSKISQYS